MLGFSIGIVNEGSRLVVSIPIDVWIFLFTTLPMLLWIGALRQVKTPRGRRNGVLAITINLAVIGAFCTPGKVVLDAKSNTASISTMMFFIPHHHTLPLSQIQGAMVKTADLSEALVVMLPDGHGIQMTAFNQQSGADEAASAINQFVGAHGGEGSPD